jgi:hypothetical protein
MKIGAQGIGMHVDVQLHYDNCEQRKKFADAMFCTSVDSRGRKEERKAVHSIEPKQRDKTLGSARSGIYCECYVSCRS